MSSLKPRVGFFGIEGSFTHKTTKAYFRDEATLVENGTFRDIFINVKKGVLDFGVVPIENTLSGSIYENYDLLEEYKLHIRGEISSRVTHCLLVSKQATGTQKTIISGLREVYSHEKALEQCSVFFKQHPFIKPIAYTSTAEAAKFVSQSNDTTIGALADADNANLYDLHIAKTGVENNKYNYTRFLVISKKEHQEPNANKCSLVLQLPHETGSLSNVLNLLKNRDCNLTKIESRPIQSKPFEYTFYIDFVFDFDTRFLNKVLRELEKKVASMRLLGIYPDERVIK